MYTPHTLETFQLRGHGELIHAVATLKDGCGGVAHIYTDDHCYVLAVGGENQDFYPAWHWFPEAVDALKLLPTPKYA
jgi:hypothetical protein